MSASTDSHRSDRCSQPVRSAQTTQGKEPANGTIAEGECCDASDGQDSISNKGVLSSALHEVLSEEIPAEVAAIRSAGFKLLLETGQPVVVDDLIAATDVSPARAIEIFESVRARGRIEFDAKDRLIGLAGLSLTPSRHEVTINGSKRWTWCALDAIGILGALKATGTVRSDDAQTGDTIRIGFVDGHPDADAHLFILSGFDTNANVREDWCSQVNFFRTRRAAEEWVGANGHEGDILTVAEVAEEAATMWHPVVDVDAPQVC